MITALQKVTLVSVEFMRIMELWCRHRLKGLKKAEQKPYLEIEGEAKNNKLYCLFIRKLTKKFDCLQFWENKKIKDGSD